MEVGPVFKAFKALKAFTQRIAFTFKSGKLSFLGPWLRHFIDDDMLFIDNLATLENVKVYCSFRLGLLVCFLF